jgi:hypothetical protein
MPPPRRPFSFIPEGFDVQQGGEKEKEVEREREREGEREARI